MKDEISRTEIEEFFSIRLGDLVEGNRGNGCSYKGIVELTAADMGIIWIRTDAGERKILDVLEDHVRLIHRPPS